MLQLQVIRKDPKIVKEKLLKRNFHDVQIIDTILELDEQIKVALNEKEQIQGNINTLSKETGILMAKREVEKANEIKESVIVLKSKLTPLSEKLEKMEIRLKNMLVTIPNLPSEKVPQGKNAADNLIIREGGIKPILAPNALPHWDLIRKFDIVDFETGAKITGSGFPLYKGAGARLQRALIQYFLDYNATAGYTEYIPPFMVNEASAFATGQLPDKEGQMYFMPEDNFYMIPTSEVPITNIYRDTILRQDELPIKMTAYSPCFRREAGSFGKDVRGLNRVHQFEKVEIVQITEAEKSYEALDEMVSHVEQLLHSLKLPYRILLLCGGDMGFTSALTYDFEVYSAAQDKWLEVSSVSNFENYQSNRLKCRYRDENSKMKLVHTLNGSSLALPRIFASILENNQLENRILLPEVLQNYMGIQEIALHSH
ncbi:MAG: serine--tRNA ligase [Bacteroidetes bacterium]|nr:serine--tRNA ligase [Bacteroidota bacterium]